MKIYLWESVHSFLLAIAAFLAEESARLHRSVAIIAQLITAFALSAHVQNLYILVNPSLNWCCSYFQIYLLEMDVARELLNNLMGRDRNKPKGDTSGRDHYSNRDVSV